MPNGAVGGNASAAERSCSGAWARAPSAIARARPGFLKAPTWIAHAPPEDVDGRGDAPVGAAADRLGSGRGGEGWYATVVVLGETGRTAAGGGALTAVAV